MKSEQGGVLAEFLRQRHLGEDLPVQLPGGSQPLEGGTVVQAPLSQRPVGVGQVDGLRSRRRPRAAQGVRAGCDCSGDAGCHEGMAPGRASVPTA